MKDRKGALTPDQEKLLDKIIKLKGAAEKLDGPAIKLIDNQGIDRILDNQSDEVKQVVYEVVDIIFEGLASLTAKTQSVPDDDDAGDPPD